MKLIYSEEVQKFFNVLKVNDVRDPDLVVDEGLRQLTQHLSTLRNPMILFYHGAVWDENSKLLSLPEVLAKKECSSYRDAFLKQLQQLFPLDYEFFMNYPGIGYKSLREIILSHTQEVLLAAMGELTIGQEASSLTMRPGTPSYQSDAAVLAPQQTPPSTPTKTPVRPQTERVCPGAPVHARRAERRKQAAPYAHPVRRSLVAENTTSRQWVPHVFCSTKGKLESVADELAQLQLR